MTTEWKRIWKDLETMEILICSMILVAIICPIFGIIFQFISHLEATYVVLKVVSEVNQEFIKVLSGVFTPTVLKILFFEFGFCILYFLTTEKERETD